MPHGNSWLRRLGFRSARVHHFGNAVERTEVLTPSHIARHLELLDGKGANNHATHRVSSTQYAVHFAVPAYYVVWGVVFVAHGLIALVFYFESYWHLHIQFEDDSEGTFDNYVRWYGLGLVNENVRAAVFFTDWCIVGWHCWAMARIILPLSWMLQRSKRVLNHLPWQHASSTTTDSSKSKPSPWLWQLTREFFDLFDVNSKHFDTVMEVREAIEVVSQTNQAYRLSLMMQNASYQHLMGSILILNSWSTPIIRSVWGSDESKKRLAALVLDLLLVMCTSIVLPIFTVFQWLMVSNDVDTDSGRILGARLLELCLMNSWQSLILNWLPICAMALTMETIKSLIYERQASALEIQLFRRVEALVKERDSNHRTKRVPDNTVPSVDIRPPILNNFITRSIKSVASSRVGLFKSKRLQSVRVVMQSVPTIKTDFVFLLYGLIIVVVYLHTVMQVNHPRPATSECQEVYYPWLASSDACAIVTINCIVRNTTGSRADMASILSEFHPSIVTYLTLRHCRELELPHQLQTFSRLMKIDIYNSTIVAWPDDAALTATHHPYLAMVYLRLVEFGGTLPACLLAKTFPPTVGEIIIAFTDLTSLPENLREVWPGPLGMLVIEHSPLESLPVSFLTSVNFTENLSFSGNQITTLPIEIFQLCCAAVLMIDNPITNISQGQAPTEIAMKASIDLSGSRLVSLPEWMSADYLHAQDVLIVLGGSPLCDLLIEEFTALLMTPSLDVAGKNCSSTDNESSMSDYDFFSKISANKSIWCSTTTEYMVNLLSYEELASLPNGADGV